MIISDKNQNKIRGILVGAGLGLGVASVAMSVTKGKESAKNVPVIFFVSMIALYGASFLFKAE